MRSATSTPLDSVARDFQQNFLNGLIGSPAGGYGRALDADMEVEIVRAYSSGKTSQEVANAFGVGRSTINRIIVARGQQKSPTDYLRRYSDAITNQAISLARAGHKQDAICEQLGFSKPTLYQILKKAGLTKTVKRRSRQSRRSASWATIVDPYFVMADDEESRTQRMGAAMKVVLRWNCVRCVLTGSVCGRSARAGDACIGSAYEWAIDPPRV
jgi:DNA invertase Pin-like site-specific DNA recombinase